MVKPELQVLHGQTSLIAIFCCLLYMLNCVSFSERGKLDLRASEDSLAILDCLYVGFFYYNKT